MRTALIFRERLLAPSETFIVEQAKPLRRFRPVLTGLRRTPLVLQHGLTEILLRDGCNTFDQLAANLYRNFPIAPGYHTRLRAVSPSIVHAHFALDAMQGLSIAKRLNLPLVVSLHGYDVTSTYNALRATYAGRHYLRHRSRLFREADSFLCVSRFLRDAAIGAGFPESKLHLHYTGIDCNRFQPSRISREPNLILFVGRLVEKKGCEHLLRSIPNVLRHHPDAKVEIIGDGPLRESLERMATELSLPVSFRGVQNPDEVLRSMSRARILCNPSIKAQSGDMEGFGMVFAEAQAVGTPVVSYAHAAIPEVVIHGKTGLLCPEGNTAELSQALRELLENSMLWTSMSDGASAWVRENFNLAKQTQILESLYEECIAQHSCKQMERWDFQRIRLNCCDARPNAGDATIHADRTKSMVSMSTSPRQQ